MKLYRIGVLRRVRFEYFRCRRPGNREIRQFNCLDQGWVTGNQRNGLAPHTHMGFGKRRLIDKSRNYAEAIVARDVGGSKNLHCTRQRCQPAINIANGEIRGGMRRTDRTNQQGIGGRVIGSINLGSIDFGQAIQPLNTRANGLARIGIYG
jgi:hypothetical protein